MKNRSNIGIRYCGGCNPRFDRVQFVRNLQEEFPALNFVYAEEDELYAAVLIVNGCSSMCASQTGLRSETEILGIKSESDYPVARALLSRVLSL